MSKIQVSGLVNSLREKTTIYSPIIESITNSVYAIAKTKRNDGYIKIKMIRSNQNTIDDSKPDVIGFEIEDNGIGFNEENKNSFDTAFSDLKREYGGKGVGRFIFLKFFKNVSVESTYIDGVYKKLTFDFNKESNTNIVSNLKIKPTTETDTKTKIIFNELNPKKQFREKNLETIAKSIFEKILMYFVDEDQNTPRITLYDDEDSIVLNNYLADSNKIQKITAEVFCLPNENNKSGEFTITLFKIYSPNNQNNKISLLAHKIEVEDISMGTADKLFSERFIEDEKNYIIKAYVTSAFLDDRVSQERTRFDLPEDSAGVFDEEITKKDIIEKTIQIVKHNLGVELKNLSDRRDKYVQDFLDSNPYYKNSKESVDYSKLSIKPSDAELEQVFHKAQYENRVKVKNEARTILEKNGFDKEEKIEEILSQLNQANKEELAKYVSERKVILDFLGKALEAEDGESFKKEDLLHSIIHPMRTNSDEISYENHNLWIIDERLNFTNYISSDEPLESMKRPDIIAVRMDNEYANPITIYELKRPGRDDFVDNPKDDPILQIINYRNRIAEGELKTPKNRSINVLDTTPFYGYIICELTAKVRKWLEFTKDYAKTPDNDGYFKYNSNMNMYIEVISWDKLLKDAKQRNDIFFKKLGL
jgi:hypothetical protein